MKRNFSLLLLILCLVMFTTVQAYAATTVATKQVTTTRVSTTSINGINPDDKVYIDAGLATANEKKQLTSKAQALYQAYKVEVLVLLTDDDTNKSDADFADDFYDYNGFQTDGLLLVINTQLRSCYISTSGKAIGYFTDARIDEILYDSSVDSALRGGRYPAAAARFLVLAEETLELNTNFRVADDAGVLDSWAQEALNKEMHGYKKQYANDFFIFTVNVEAPDTQTELKKALQRHPEYKNTGTGASSYAGVALLYNAYDESCTVICSGTKAEQRLSSYAREQIATDAKLLLASPPPVVTEYPDDTPSHYNRPGLTAGQKAIASLLAGIVTACIALVIMRGRNKLGSAAVNPRGYVKSNSFRLTIARNDYITSTVTRTKIQHDAPSGGGHSSSGSSGGSSTHTSSSGSTHGGGGRSF